MSGLFLASSCPINGLCTLTHLPRTGMDYKAKVCTWALGRASAVVRYCGVRVQRVCQIGMVAFATFCLSYYYSHVALSGRTPMRSCLASRASLAHLCSLDARTTDNSSIAFSVGLHLLMEDLRSGLHVHGRLPSGLLHFVLVSYRPRCVREIE